MRPAFRQARAFATALAAVSLLLTSMLLATGCGGLKYIDPKTPEDVSWRRMRGPRTVAPQPQPVAAQQATKPRKRAVVAVFDIENKGTTLDGATLDRLTQYLATQLAASGRFLIVPRDELKKRLHEKKAESYKKCYAQSCQIDIGRELAAQKSLATVLLRIGSRCLVTVALYDLKKAAAERGGSAKGDCSEDALVSSLETVVQRLVKQ